MKHIMISIKPEWVEKIKKGDKILEIRKSIPKELPCKVYIYETKSKWRKPYGKPETMKDYETFGWGKVVASFTLMHYNKFDVEGLDWWDMKDIMLKNSCLTEKQLKDYLGDKIGYAWHIEDLHIYDQPKELAEFGLKRPPQSWCYIEGEENENHI